MNIGTRRRIIKEELFIEDATDYDTKINKMKKMMP